MNGAALNGQTRSCGVIGEAGLTDASFTDLCALVRWTATFANERSRVSLPIATLPSPDVTVTVMSVCSSLSNTVSRFTTRWAYGGMSYDFLA